MSQFPFPEIALNHSLSETLDGEATGVDHPNIAGRLSSESKVKKPLYEWDTELISSSAGGEPLPIRLRQRRVTHISVRGVADCDVVLLTEQPSQFVGIFRLIHVL